MGLLVCPFSALPTVFSFLAFPPSFPQRETLTPHSRPFHPKDTPSLLPRLTRLVLTQEPESDDPVQTITLTGSKAMVALFAPLSDHILIGHESGKVSQYDSKTGEELIAVEDAHTKEITDIQLSPDGTYFITSSKDKTARVS